MTFKAEPRRPANAWIVVADRARARIFSAEWPSLKDFSEVLSLTHPEGGLRPTDVETREGGQFRTHAGRAVSGQPTTDFRHKTAIEFARQVIDSLEAGRTNQRFGQLLIVAPPLFLGVMREQLPEPLARLVQAEIEKDLVQLPAREIQERLSGAPPVQTKGPPTR